MSELRCVWSSQENTSSPFHFLMTLTSHFSPIVSILQMLKVSDIKNCPQLPGNHVSASVSPITGHVIGNQNLTVQQSPSRSGKQWLQW